ncbi:MAG: outer membrane beta-barrel protein [Bacteroidia bacterium]
MKKYLSLLFFITTIFGHAQTSSVKGNMISLKGEPLAYATVALLNPADSTLAFFGITNPEGAFEIKNITSGNYLLQSSYLGYKTLYKQLQIPLPNGENIGALVMQQLSTDLKEVQVIGERIPITLKKDTIEYNAGAFKTKPDAVTEDLLKKLPGIEVDRAGNVKAQGEDVKKVLVDGKEFFGNDIKVATKNLPADAIKKVQVYDKKSDQSEITGIDDGSREKTINLELKDDKKNAWFGDVSAGAGTNEHYKGSAKIYRFKKQSQFAALGMLNNINQFGFSFQDYMSFSGGLQNMMNSESGPVSFGGEENSFPINFGQPVTGLITSGAGGLNYTYEPVKNKRFNISYMGNGDDKNLIETAHSTNFLSGSSYMQDQNTNELSKERNHRLTINIRNSIDSTQTLFFNGSAQLINSKTKTNSFAQTYLQNSLWNSLDNNSTDNSAGMQGDGNASYIKNLSSKWKYIKLTASGSAKQTLGKTQWDNLLHYFDLNSEFNNMQFQQDQNKLYKYSGGASAARSIGNKYYLEPKLEAGDVMENLKRKQGIPAVTEVLIDSLSPLFTREYKWIRPGIDLKKSTEKSQFVLSGKVEIVQLLNQLNKGAKQTAQYVYFIPAASWSREYKTGHRLACFYNSQLNAPTAKQLLPVINIFNPLQLYAGNTHLKPEYEHDGRINWMIFDQFSFTSFFLGLNGTYTKDKINWSRSVDNNLSEKLTLVNVVDDYRFGGTAEFSTPIRKLGLNIEINLDESWNKGINIVNDIQNINTNRTHAINISLNNRKKEKWDIRVGGTGKISTSQYSVQQSLNNLYYNAGAFSEISYTPAEHWRLFVSADLTRYYNKSFGQSIDIPLLTAEVSRYFFKGNRGTFTLEGFDLLNKNTGLERISELNYLLEKKSNIIGRYFMLSFKYRLNKFEDKSGMNIQVKAR